MAKRNRSGAIWRAVCSTIDNCLEIFKGSARWIAYKGTHLFEPFESWGQVEPLERRVYLSGLPYVSGLPHAEVGQTYTLNLLSNGYSFSNWVINWGDGTSTADLTTLTASHSFATHTFTFAASSFVINAKALDSSG